ncbi:hypothetical protein AB0L06_11095 [Spirillospora sp. NPDC052269]
MYSVLCHWQRVRVRLWITTALQARVDVVVLITLEVGVDSTIARTHQHAAGRRARTDGQKEPPGETGDEPAGQGWGRSRGGPTARGPRSSTCQRVFAASVTVIFGILGGLGAFEARGR